jgi:hypothetical protein
MHLPASRLAAMALAAVVLLMAEAPSAAAKKGSQPHKRREPGIQRVEKKDSPGHHRGHEKPNGGSGHGHGHKRVPGKTKHGGGRHHRPGTSMQTSPDRRGTASSALRRLRLPTHDRIDVPEARPGKAAARPAARRPRPIRAGNPGTIETAAVETGRALAFPMFLSLLALGFIFGHGRMDARDPKLARAPVNQTEQLVAFE